MPGNDPTSAGVTMVDQKRLRVLDCIFYAFTFPLFMFTYIPISVTALLVDPGWKPIRHSVAFAPHN